MDKTYARPYCLASRLCEDVRIQATGDNERSTIVDPLKTSDGRLLRGVRSRRLIARQAADVASVEGLNGLSFGRLAADVGLSKSGVQALFKSKENLQLAAIEAAREAFLDAVVRPAQSARPGVARIRALLANWIDYAEAPLFPGGCFRAANVAELDGRPGPVRDALFRDLRDWRSSIAAELRQAVDAGEIADLDPDLAAFQIDAALCAANSELRLGDTAAVGRVRRVVEAFLVPPR
jgi:AcrR family transcriptional regulator